MKILVLVAHPDDETILCGGTIDKLVQKGHAVHVTFYTKNCQGYFNNETQNARKKRAINEARNSSKILGFHLNFLSFHDMEIEKNKGILIQDTIHEIRRTSPDIIITHHFADKHIDHRTLGEIVPEANFQSGCAISGGKKRWSAQAVLQGEINLEMTMPFDFQIVSALSKENINNKLSAFSCYKSVKDEHESESEWLNNRLSAVAQLRGKSIGDTCGEAFTLSNYSPLNGTSLELVSDILKI